MSDETTGKDGQSFGELLKQFFSKLPQEGELVEGSVISVDNGSVRLDIGGVAIGVVRGEELFAEATEYSNIKVGDKVHATVVDLENEQGEMELSFRIAGQQMIWEKMRKWRDEEITVSARVLNANKGGLMMRIDALNGFMPVSQLTPDHYPRVPGGDKNRILEHLRQFIGNELQVKVIDFDQKQDKLIVSEKAVWEDEQKAVLDQYQIGTIVDGEISALTTFGAFMKFGTGLEGLIHISEIVWQRIDHPRDVLKVGDKVKAQIIDLNKSKIYLSMKRLIDDPWKIVKDTYTIGQVVEGEIHKVESFGLMVKLDEQIHGLAHVSELADKPMTEKELQEAFSVGETKQFEIVSIEPAEHRLGLKLNGVKGKKKTDDAGKATKAENAEEEKALEPKESVEEEKANNKEESIDEIKETVAKEVSAEEKVVETEEKVKDGEPEEKTS